MAVLGAHMSIAGGYHRAVDRAAESSCDCVQIFTKNNNQWRAKTLTEDDIAKFRAALVECNISHPIAHSSYLINLASPDKQLWRKSVDAFVVELQRAEALGLQYLVVHPGAHTTSTEKAGVRAVARALNTAHKRTPGLLCQCLLETTAGQGSSLGWRFEQLAAILDGVKAPDRVGVCFDTCHVFAAGYPLSVKKDYLATMRAFNKTVGCEQIKAFHLNDSKRELGSRVDRHENIGLGCLGLEAFRHLLNDRRFRRTPMYLETPKGSTDDDQDWDIVNLRRLRRLIVRKR